MKEQLRTWLNNPQRDYWEGVEMYVALGDNAYFKKLAKKREDDFNRKRLVERLRSVYRQMKSPKVEEQPAVSVSSQVSEKSGYVAPGTFTTAQQDLIEKARNTANRKYQEFKNKRALLFALCPLLPDRMENSKQRVEERFAIIKELIPLREQSDKLYSDYHYAAKHGELPNTPKVLVPKLNAVQLVNKKNNLMKNLSWHRRQEDQTSERLNIIAKKEKELALIYEQLNSLG